MDGAGLEETNKKIFHPFSWLIIMPQLSRRNAKRQAKLIRGRAHKATQKRHQLKKKKRAHHLGSLALLPNEMIARILFHMDRTSIRSFCLANRELAPFCSDLTFWTQWARHYHRISSDTVTELRQQANGNSIAAFLSQVDAYVLSRRILHDSWRDFWSTVYSNATTLPRPHRKFFVLLTLRTRTNHKVQLFYDAYGDQQLGVKVPHGAIFSYNSDKGSRSNPFPSVVRNYSSLLDMIADTNSSEVAKRWARDRYTSYTVQTSKEPLI